MTKSKIKCGLCKGFGLVKVRKCKHCVICPHCRGKGYFDSSVHSQSHEFIKTYAQDISQYKNEYIIYNLKNRPPFKIIEE